MFIRHTRHMWGITAPTLIVTAMIAGCAGGLMGSKEDKLAYFDGLEKETLARLIKEQPKTEQELAQSVGYVVGEKKVVRFLWSAAAAGQGLSLRRALESGPM